MKAFKAIFQLEVSRFFCFRNLGLFLAVLALLIVFTQEGASEFNSIQENKKTFQETEKTKVQQYRLMTQYGAYGIRLMFIPSPVSILFNNSGLFRELYSNVDVGERLNIYYSFKGRRVFTEPGGFMDFSGILLLFASFLCLLSGFDALRHREFLTFLTTLTNRRALLYSTIVSRIILLNLSFLLLASLSNLVLLVVNGINLFSWHFLCLILVLWLLSAFFTVFGSITGMFKNKVVGFFALLAVFFIFIFFFPWTVNKVARINAESLIPNYKVELEKLKTIMGFEDKVYKEIGIYKSGKVASDRIKKLYQSYIDNEYKRILEIEETAKKGVIKKIDFYQFISALIPTPFYFSVGNELSSRGYSDFVYFYTYNQKIKDGFFKFYIFRKFDAPISEIESYIKGDENLFYAESRLPAYFELGILMTIFYIAGAMGFADFQFKKTMVPGPKIKGAFKDLYIELKSGKPAFFEVYEQDFIYQFLNVLAGYPKNFTGKMSFNGNSILTNEKIDFTFLPNPSQIPGDITVKALIRFFKQILNLSPTEMQVFKPWQEKGSIRIKKLEKNLAAKLLLAAAQLMNRRIYIFHDFLSGIPDGLKRDITDNTFAEMKARGAVIVYIAPNPYIFFNVDYQTAFYLEGSKYIERKIHDYPPQTE